MIGDLLAVGVGFVVFVWLLLALWALVTLIVTSGQ